MIIALALRERYPQPSSFLVLQQFRKGEKVLSSMESPSWTPLLSSHSLSSLAGSLRKPTTQDFLEVFYTLRWNDYHGSVNLYFRKLLRSEIFSYPLMHGPRFQTEPEGALVPGLSLSFSLDFLSSPWALVDFKCLGADLLMSSSNPLYSNILMEGNLSHYLAVLGFREERFVFSRRLGKLTPSYFEEQMNWIEKLRSSPGDANLHSLIFLSSPSRSIPPLYLPPHELRQGVFTAEGWAQMNQARLCFSQEPLGSAVAKENSSSLLQESLGRSPSHREAWMDYNIDQQKEPPSSWASRAAAQNPFSLPRK